MEDFKDQVRKGFQNCRLDIEDVKQENLELKGEVKTLTQTISELKSELKGISIAMEYIKEFNANKPLVVEEKPVMEIAAPVKQKEPIIQTTEDPYNALLAFKAKSNKRDVLKQKLISLVSQGGVSLSELKFLFVDHYKYCSKATFYNYLKELELERQIKIERENSKNVVFTYNQLEKEI